MPAEVGDVAKMARGQGVPVLKLWIRGTRVSEEICAPPAKAILKILRTKYLFKRNSTETNS